MFSRYIEKNEWWTTRTCSTGTCTKTRTRHSNPCPISSPVYFPPTSSSHIQSERRWWWEQTGDNNHVCTLHKCDALLYLEVSKHKLHTDSTCDSWIPLSLCLSPLSFSLFPCEEGSGYREETRNFTNKHLCFMCVVVCVTLSVIGKIQTNYESRSSRQECIYNAGLGYERFTWWLYLLYLVPPVPCLSWFGEDTYVVVTLVRSNMI